MTLWRRTPGRRGLATARTKAGEVLVGDRDTLELPGRVVRWEEILGAEWDSETDILRVMLVQPEVIELSLDQPDLLLQLVRERVTASIVLTRRAHVDGDLGLTVMARRPPSGGEISFTVEYDAGLDPDQPAVRSAAQEAVREVRGDLGL